MRQKSFIDSLPLGADPEFYEFFTGNSFENEEHLKILIGRNKKNRAHAAALKNYRIVGAKSKSAACHGRALAA